MRQMGGSEEHKGPCLGRAELLKQPLAQTAAHGAGAFNQIRWCIYSGTPEHWQIQLQDSSFVAWGLTRQKMTRKCHVVLLWKGKLFRKLQCYCKKKKKKWRVLGPFHAFCLCFTVIDCGKKLLDYSLTHHNKVFIIIPQQVQAAVT